METQNDVDEMKRTKGAGLRGWAFGMEGGGI
jgi:hypothetical protein